MVKGDFVLDVRIVVNGKVDAAVPVAAIRRRKLSTRLALARPDPCSKKCRLEILFGGSQDFAGKDIFSNMMLAAY